MYRTSFSAVTSPKRVPKKTSPNQSDLTSQSSFMTSQTSFIATPLRATMPGRITSVDRSKQSCDSVDMSATSISNDNQAGIRTSHNHSTSIESPPAGQKVTQAPSSAKYESEVQPMSPLSPLVNGGSRSVAPPAERSNCNAFSTSKQSETADHDSPSSPCRVGISARVECAEVTTKRMTEKEFVHITDIGFFDGLKKKHVMDDRTPPSEKKRTRSPFRWSKRPNNSYGVNTNNNGGNSEPNSPAKDGSKLSSDDLLPRGGRAVRSTTLPSEMLTGGGAGSPTSVKKSSKKKSKSITSFFQVSTLPST